MRERHIRTVVIGAGQAGLATGYHLQQQRGEFLLLDAGTEVGASWRQRWDSLRLFTPACADSLPGMAFPATKGHLPTKDEMADYLQAYATRLDLPIEHDVHVEEVRRHDGRFLITAGTQRLTADHVIVATGANRTPRIPGFAQDLDPAITQLHSADYRSPDQLEAGTVLVVGAGNSGCEIALELAGQHTALLAGRDVGHLPWVPGCTAYRVLQHVRVDTWYGRWVADKRSTGGDPVVRVRPGHLHRAGVDRVPAVAGVRDGKPVLDDHRVIDVDHVIWATGFGNDLSWIRLPPVDGAGMLAHDRGVAVGVPGLGIVGMPLQRTIVSDLVGGVGADAGHVVARLAGQRCG